MTEVVKSTRQLLRDSAGARWTALILLASMMFFGYLFVDILSPLKETLTAMPGWDSTTFGLYASAEFFLNVFVFFLIFAGIILDKMGIRFSALFAGSLMVIGAAIKLYAMSEAFPGSGLHQWLSSWWTSFPANAKLAGIGFMLFGCGCEMAGITVSKAIAKWFKGKEMALAMGVEMGVARLGGASAFLVAPFIKTHYPDYAISGPIAFSLALLCVGMICFIVYVFMDAKLDKQTAGSLNEAEDPFRVSDLGKLLKSAPFMLIALLCVLYYSAIIPFQRYATNMLQCNLGMTESEAGAIFFWFPIGAAAITPFLGYFLDTRGKGATMLSIGAAVMVMCHLIFAFVPLNVPIALGTIVLLGISFSLVPASLWPSVPKIVPSSYLGTAYALIFWVQNIGLFLTPILIGRVLDSTNPVGTSSVDLNYTWAMLLFSCFGVVAIFLSLTLKWLDGRHQYGLELPNKK